MVMNRANLVLTVIGLTVSLFLANIASAENKTFIKEYTYMASDIDSKVSSRAIALELVKRALLEQLGTYLISETEVKNYQLTKDQIATLSAGIVSAEVIEEKWDGKTYYLQAKMEADPNEVAKSVDVLRNDVQKSKELEDSRKQAREAIREVERLKKELELIKGDVFEQASYTNAVNKLSASDWFDKGLAFQRSNNLQDAIDAYNKVIELNPKYAAAYYNEGIANSDLGNYQQAINNYNSAIKLHPKLAVAYNSRGVAYTKTGNKQLAMNDFNSAIKFNQKYAAAYHNRGMLYNGLGNFKQAMNDFNNAIKLNPNAGEAYFGRGVTYATLGNNRQALNNFNKAIKLNPKFAAAYFGRAYIHFTLGSTDKSIQDYHMAAQLGLKEAQEFLDSRGIAWQ